MELNFSLATNMEMRAPSKGQLEMTSTSRFFDAAWYISTYPDVALTGLTPEQHFLQVGVLLLRDPSPYFSTSYYLSDNPDIAELGVNPFLHYLNHGLKEGRSAIPLSGHMGTHGPQMAEAIGPGELFQSVPDRSKFESMVGTDSGVYNTLPINFLKAAAAVLKTSSAPPKISVIMPTWNRVHVISDAVDSVLAQRFPPMELLVVDDGSDDGTLDLLETKYNSQIASGIIRVVKGVHMGVSAARNIGLHHAKGDLIAYLDSDNIWRPEYLQVMAATFVENPELMTAYSGLALNDRDKGVQRVRGQKYNRRFLLRQNYIDLNVFIHRRIVFEQLGGFDESLKRLVDWDLILRYTKLYEPIFLPFVGVDYVLDKVGLANISRTVPIEGARNAVRSNNIRERLRHGLDTMRLAYVVWDWPAMSQTFLLSELRWLVTSGIDVKVYFHTGVDREANLDFDIRTEHIANVDELVAALERDDRTLCHNHFVFPGTTQLVWPASQRLGIPFTLFAHAVDIFQDKNVGRNRIAEIAADPLCLKIFVHEDYHRKFLAEHGVPPSKIGYNLQAVNLTTFDDVAPPPPRSKERPIKGIVVARMVEKKGIPTLIHAMRQLTDVAVEVDIYGYGPLEAECRELAQSLNLTNLRFLGPLDTPAACALALSNADFMIVPSVVAKNGDTEGFPTVILEAMAAGRPVVTTTVAAIPDFLNDGHDVILTEPGDPNSLADGIRRLLAMSPEATEALVANSQDLIKTRVGVEKTMQRYWDVWTENVVSLFMVTYNTPKYDDAEATFEIIDRVLNHTTMPFTLTIVDNASEASFRERLTKLAKKTPQIRLVLLDENRFCGPASNLALSYGDAKYAIYICSKEGFVAKHGWERTLVDYMRNNPEVGLAGYQTHMPRHTLGSELATHPRFAEFRNPEFAHANPTRPFQHVQGGVFILDRDVFATKGGFSEQLFQDMMDVEYSYFLESEGIKLGKIDAVASLTVKTHPTLPAILSERTVIAHPMTLETARSRLDPLTDRATTYCNLCDTMQALDTNGVCTTCKSTGFGRKIFSTLAHDWRCHRGERAFLDCPSDPALVKVLGTKMFDVHYKLEEGPFKLMVLSHPVSEAERMSLAQNLAPDGIAFLPEPREIGIPNLPLNLTGTRLTKHSRALRTDWRPLLRMHRPAD